MIRSFVLRFLVPVALFLLLRYLFKTIADTFRSTSPQTAQKQPPPIRTGGELKKDPVCGTYVSADTAVTRTVKGEVLHFCSEECRDRYRS